MDLPLSWGSNSLLVVVDQLTKSISLLPSDFGPDHPFGAGGAADLLVCHIVCKYSVPRSIVHNQDIQFTMDLW